MSYFKSLKHAGKVVGVLSMMTLAVGCSTFNDPGPVAVGPELPPMPEEYRQGCRDPGVNQDAIVALTENRLALSACRRLHRDTVLFYDELRTDLAETE